MFEIGDTIRRKDNDYNYVVIDKGTYFYELENIVSGETGQVAKNLVELDFELSENSYDNVNKPKHYNVFEIEVLDIIRILLSGNKNYTKDGAYKIGNVIKYIFRAGLKGDMLEDLQKAKFYLDSIIKKGVNVSNEQ